MKEWLALKTVGLILPVILGPLTYLAMKGLKAGTAWIDRQSSWVQRCVVVAISAVLAGVSQTLGVDLACLDAPGGCTLAHLDQTAVRALLGAVVAMGMHHLRKLPA